MVDEAHGAHFGSHPQFPPSALEAGADVVVQSTHKMLGAMTMGAMLHMQGKRVPRAAIRQALTMVQSSSPSFPIMASLDLARWQLNNDKERLFSSAMDAALQVVKALEKTSFRALGYGDYISADIVYDPLKLVLFDESGCLTGFALRDELEKQLCIAEMADERYVVLALGPGTTLEDGQRLKAALADIAGRKQGSEPGIKPLEGNPKETLPFEEEDEQSAIVPEPILFDREERLTVTVSLESSIGRKAAEWVIPYPPGIPVLYPGETITEATVSQLQRWRHEGARIQGVRDPRLSEIQVWQENNG